MEIDMSTDFGARAAKHLADDQIVWLTTVGADSTPQPSPVWFLWDGETALIYSQPNAPKLRNIAANPHVSLHFDGDGQGGDIVVLTGDAWIDSDAPLASGVPAYVEKYTEGVKRMQSTPEDMAQAYSTAIRVKPTSLRGH